jgi:hypothetical protein
MMMIGAAMSRVVMTGVMMIGAVMTGAVMTGATMTCVVMSHTVMIGATMSRAMMSHAMMIGAVMSPGAMMEGARRAQTVHLLPLLMYVARFARYMVTLPVIVGGAMAMILMMKEIVITRLPTLRPMALTPTGIFIYFFRLNFILD